MCVLWEYDQLAVLPALYNATLEYSCQHTDRTIHRYNNYYVASIVHMTPLTNTADAINKRQVNVPSADSA